MDDFVRHGAAIVEAPLSGSDLWAMSEAFSSKDGSNGLNRQTGMSPTLIAWLWNHRSLADLATSLVGAPAHLCRAIAFDKTAEINWFVPWHQDRTIAVAARVGTPGFAHWTFKDGCHYVEPPVALLESMVTLRVHLDDCGRDNGPLEVVLGSHRGGRLDRSAVAAVAAQGETRVCPAARGEVFAMRPLVVHRSRRARSPARRRVLHLEYASQPLPEGLCWALSA